MQEEKSNLTSRVASRGRLISSLFASCRAGDDLPCIALHFAHCDGRRDATRRDASRQKYEEASAPEEEAAALLAEIVHLYLYKYLEKSVSDSHLLYPRSPFKSALLGFLRYVFAYSALALAASRDESS